MSRLTSIRDRARDEDGVVAVIVAFTLIVVLAAAALAIDMGYTYLQQRRLQAAVDYSVMAAAQDLQSAPNSATGDAQTFLNNNWKQNGNTTNPTSTVLSCAYSSTNPTPCTTSSPACVSGSPCQIRVTASSPVPTPFGGIFGTPHTYVSAQGSACGGCDTVTQRLDIVVVLDRSYSMCLNSSGGQFADGKCDSLISAEQGILNGLLPALTPANDRVALDLISSSNGFNAATRVGNPPCDGANVSDYQYETSHSGYGPFYQTLGDFTAGTSTSSGTWVVSPLSKSGNGGPYLNADGKTPNSSNEFVSDVNCVTAKFWTPIAPAIVAARTELDTDNTGWTDAKKIIVYLGDGGADIQPMQADAKGNSLSTHDWYQPYSAADNLKPCEDAVDQANAAKADNITIYTIGYNLSDSGADTCWDNNKPLVSGNADSQTASQTLSAMASPGDYISNGSPSNIQQVFSHVAASIVSNATRITQ